MFDALPKSNWHCLVFCIVSFILLPSSFFLLVHCLHFAKVCPKVSRICSRQIRWHFPSTFCSLVRSFHWLYFCLSFAVSLHFVLVAFLFLLSSLGSLPTSSNLTHNVAWNGEKHLAQLSRLCLHLTLFTEGRKRQSKKGMNSQREILRYNKASGAGKRRPRSGKEIERQCPSTWL